MKDERADHSQMRKRIAEKAVICLLFAGRIYGQQLPQPQGPDPQEVHDGDVLTFEHDLINTDHFELTIDGGPPITIINPAPYPGQQPGVTFYCQIPPLTLGLHQLILSACNGTSCLPSLPLNVRKNQGPASAPRNLRPMSAPPPPQ